MGNANGLPERLASEDERYFPELYRSGYRVTSPKDPSHNCIAYAVGDYARKWDPTVLPQPGYFWPAIAPRDGSPDSLKMAFESEGYELCAGGEPEAGFDKVALYVDDLGEWSHAAKMTDGGEWSSKLGSEEDIRHRTQHCFGGSIYGSVVYYMRKPKAENVNEEQT